MRGHDGDHPSHGAQNSNCGINNFSSHIFSSKISEDDFSQFKTSYSKVWLDPWSVRDLVRSKKERRVELRGNRILEAYKCLQREATSQALIHANKLLEKRFDGRKAVAALSGWLKMDAIGAKGLDIPGLRSTDVGKFHLKMAAARGGVVRGSAKWNGMLLPERHMDVQREAYLRRGINLPKPRETGDINDAPPHLDRRKVRAEVERHKKTANGKPLRVLVLFAGGGGSSEG